MVATRDAPIASCDSPDFGASRLVIPGTPANPAPADDVANPPRIASRHLFDLAVGVDNLFNPTHGIRAALTLTPTQSFNGGGSNSHFLIGQLAGSTYFDLIGNGRTVLALRGLAGDALGVSDVFSLPPDMRFFLQNVTLYNNFTFRPISGVRSLISDR